MRSRQTALLAIGALVWTLYILGFWPLLGLAFGVGAVIVAADGLWTAHRSRRWPAVEGEILLSEVVEGSSRSVMRWSADVTYGYRVGSTRLTGKYRHPLSDAVSWTKAWARRQADLFPAGSKVLVFYDPGSPGVSVLLPGRGALLLSALLAFGVFISSGALLEIRDRFHQDPRLLGHAWVLGAVALARLLVVRRRGPRAPLPQEGGPEEK